MKTFLDGRVTLHGGDCLSVVKEMADNSIDSVCTDPPYALVSITKRFGKDRAAPAQFGKDGAYARASSGFMGKAWDTGETAFAVEFWAEVLRVLKPGGHVAAFGGTRSYHRLACAIEDAGFEIRDQVKFEHENDAERITFLNSLDAERRAQFFKLFGENDSLGQLSWDYGTGFPKSHDVSKGIDKAAGAEREVVGQRKKLQSYGANEVFGDGPDKGGAQVITAPATDAARQWEGWGTALKPAWEPICLARKPLSERTVAANVLRWGTGAINVGACRVDAEKATGWGGKGAGGNTWDGDNCGLTKDGEARPVVGRFPANLCHDNSDEVLSAFPSPHGAGATRKGKFGGEYDATSYDMGGAREMGRFGDSGSAARFFYSAKASKADRALSKHPTVKPVKLMQWLVRLITPKNGTVLDCFAGTGTTGEAAWREGMSAVLIEREEEYQADIERRMLFARARPKEESTAARRPKRDCDPGTLDMFTLESVVASQATNGVDA